MAAINSPVGTNILSWTVWGDQLKYDWPGIAKVASH